MAFPSVESDGKNTTGCTFDFIPSTDSQEAGRLFTSFLHLLWMPLVLKQRIRNSNSWKLVQALVKTIDLHKIPKLPILHYTLHIYWEKWLVSSPNNFTAIWQKDLNPTTLRAALNHWLHTFRDLKFDGKPSRNRDFRLCSVFHGVKQHSLGLLLWRRCQTTSSRGGIISSVPEFALSSPGDWYSDP